MKPTARILKKVTSMTRAGRAARMVATVAATKQQRAGLWASFQTLVRMLKAWLRRDYTLVPWRTLFLLAGTLAYFVSPIDLIPDVIPLFGILDDVTIFAFVLRGIQKDLNLFSEWENKMLRPAVVPAMK